MQEEGSPGTMSRLQESVTCGEYAGRLFKLTGRASLLGRYDTSYAEEEACAELN